MSLFGGKKRRSRLEESGVEAQAVLKSFREVSRSSKTPAPAKIAAAVQATGDTGQRKSAADLLASGQRMTAVLREFSAAGKMVGDLNPTLLTPTIRCT